MAESVRSPKQPTAEQIMIGALLLELSGNAFVIRPKKNSSYISLDIQIGKSRNNKNAVSVSRHLVSFMVSDWRFVEQARQLGMTTEEDFEHKKIKFSGLTVSMIRANSMFFQEILSEAKRASTYRQGA